MERQPGQKVWAVGFPDTLVKWLEENLGDEQGGGVEAFNNGEQVLVSLSQALLGNQPPDLLILNLRLSIINGINVAIAARAFELGYNRRDRIPIIFLFDPPESSSFDKVIKFCQPLRVVSPSEGEDSIRLAVRELALGSRRPDNASPADKGPS